MNAPRAVDLLRRLRIAQADDRVELARLRRQTERIRGRMEARVAEIEQLESQHSEAEADPCGT